jgi:uracil-DNA glycosylase family 4
MNTSKAKAYQDLVSYRKMCHLCEGLTNPSAINGGTFDSNHIGPWSRWQGNFDSELMVIGQDWGDIEFFQDNKGYSKDNNPSNNMIRSLLASIDIEIPQPSKSNETKNPIFLTNAILCLKNKEKDPIKKRWFDNCGKNFLQPLIEITQPKVLVTLGKYAYELICKLYGLPKVQFREAVIYQKGGFFLTNDVRFFPVYHCSRLVINSKTRSIEEQKADWQKVRKVLEKK